MFRISALRLLALAAVLLVGALVAQGFGTSPVAANPTDSPSADMAAAAIGLHDFALWGMIAIGLAIFLLKPRRRVRVRVTEQHRD